MKKLVAFMLVLQAVQFAEAAEARPPLSKLEVGTRTLHVYLREDERGTGTDTRSDNFLGSIDMLDAEQDYLPLRLYVQYFPHALFGLGLSYDKVEADAHDEGGSDGIVGLEGPIAYLVARREVAPGIVPFIEGGMAFYSSFFDEDDGWAHPADRDYSRYMKTDDVQAVVLGVGCDYALGNGISFNFYGRMVDGATFDTDHYNTDNPSEPNQTGEFCLDYYGLGAGIKYGF